MSDLTIHVQVNDGEREKVTVPSEMTTGEVLTELLQGFGLPAKRNGHNLEWKLTDKTTGRTLELFRTLNENGVQSGQDLVLRTEEPQSGPAPLACKHCGFENDEKNKFCRKCGNPLHTLTATELRLIVYKDGKGEEVEVPDTFTARDLIGELLGSVAKQDEWKLYDKDTSADLDPSKTLAENGVRSGHSVYLTRIPVVTPIEDKKKGTGRDRVTSTTEGPGVLILKILAIVAVVAALAVGGVALYSRFAGRVVINPATADLKISQRQQFTATVSGAPGAVRWFINPTLGTIDSNGLYTAPHSVVAQTLVTITATSVANPNKSASGQITLEPGREVVEVSPENVTLTGGESANFTARVTGSDQAGVRWSIRPEVGNIAPDGRYTAPAPVAGEMTISVTATSTADPDRSASASVTLKPVTISVSPKNATVLAGASVRFEATLSGTSNRGIRWSLSGPGYVSKNGVYVAPPILSERGTAQVTAISSADPTKSATAVLRLQPVVAVTLGPGNHILWAGQRERFTASISGSSNTAVRWTVSGPGSVSPEGVYQAPGTINSEETARITATSDADPSKSASVSVTLRPLTVTISPANAEVWASQTRRFSASVIGASNSGIRWTLSGRGSLSQDGVYTAPPMILADQNARITATSIVDPSRFAMATVTLKRYDGPMAGTLVWMGVLPKNGTVTIDDAGASQGSIQGDMFPGLPVQIALDNNKDYGIAQPPGPSNGWKRVTLINRRGKGNVVRVTWRIVLEGEKR
jgi:hypothetical protein